jgi:hypothetical protein
MDRLPRDRSAGCDVFDAALDTRHDQGICGGEGGDQPIDAPSEVRVEIEEAKGETVGPVVSDDLGGDFDGALAGLIVKRKGKMGAHFEFRVRLNPHAPGRQIIAGEESSDPCTRFIEFAYVPIEAGTGVTPAIGVSRQGQKFFPLAERATCEGEETLARSGFEFLGGSDRRASKQSADLHALGFYGGMEAQGDLPLH